MDMNEMGKVFSYLLKYRVVESNPRGRRSSRPGEPEMARLLLSSDPDSLKAFDDFLGGQGLQLREYRDTDFKGIPVGGRVWLLMRSATEAVPAYLGVERIVQALSLRENEPRLTANTWFLHIWLMYLALVYTRLGRGVSQVSDYVDTSFTKDQLLDAVAQHVENVRQIGVDKGAEEKVFAILDAAKGGDIGRRVRGFLDLMCDAGLIELAEEDTYQQTLLGAAEFAESYGRTLRHYLNIDEGALDSLVNVANTLTGTAPEEREEAAADVAD